jgi:hypothetical protein
MRPRLRPLERSDTPREASRYTARMRALLVVGFACVAMRARAEPPRYGGAIAGAVTNLDGQIASDPSLGFAVAGIVELPFDRKWSIAAEPGVQWSGSEKYALVYVALPMVARVRHPIGAGWLVRGTAGVIASLLVKAELVTESDGNKGGFDIKQHLRWWDVGVAAGAGVERGPYFAELRWSRGLVTIHADDPSLFVVNTGLGLWIGFRQ